MPTLLEPLPDEFVSKTAFFDYKTPITKALAEINRLGAVIVMQGNDYCGVVDARTLFREGPHSLKYSKSLPLGKFMRKLPVLVAGASMSKAIDYFHEFSAKALPYMDGDKISGIVRREVLLSAIVSSHLLSKSKVSDAMSTPVIAINANANVSQAIHEMSQNKIARLVVLDKGKLSGIITQKDIAGMFTKSEDRLPEKEHSVYAPANVLVSNVAKSSVYSINYDRPIEEAIRSLLERKISSLVVLRNGRPVGLLSIRDVFTVAASHVEKERSKIIITGLDDFTKEYQDEIEDEIHRMVERVGKFSRFGVDYASVNVKKIKSKGYEFHARLGLQKKGAIFVSASGYGLEATLTQLLDNIYKIVKNRKEVIVSTSKEADRYYAE